MDYQKHCASPKTVVKLKEMLQSVWDSLPQELIDKAVRKF